jgi:hypothetical protein
MNELPAGVYKHYKGGLYLVLGVAQHSETLEKMVVYVHLGAAEGAAIWVRPYDMFFEDVDVGGIRKPRFAYIGQQVEPVIAKWYDPLSGYTGADRVND